MTGGDAALTDEITADGQNGVSFIHPIGEIFLQPLAGETDAPTIERIEDNREQTPSPNQYYEMQLKTWTLS